MDTSIAYIAGVMDSEGSFSITWNKHQATTAGIVSIANTNLPLLEYVKGQFGGTIYVQSRRHPGARTVCYAWQPSGGKMEAFIRAIHPYLRCKAEQADIMLEHLTLRMHRLTPEARKRRLELREKMLELNRAKEKNMDFVQVTGEEKPTGMYNWHKMEVQ